MRGFRVQGLGCWAAVWLWIAAGTALGGVAPVRGADYDPGKPFTYLFDTGAASPEPLAAQAVAAKRGWTLLAEDNTTHQFRGDAVLLNDKLALVLRQRGSGAEVYGQKAARTRQRAVLAPLPPALGRGTVPFRAPSEAWSRENRDSPQLRTAAAITALKIVENTPAAVSLEVTYRAADDRRLVATYGLSTGRQIVELRAGEGVGRLLVGAKTCYAIVPDLFADDMVFGPAACTGPRLGLPTENMLLSLLEGGDAILMCLWRSGRQGAAILSGDGPSRTIGGCEIQWSKPSDLWVALMEGPNLWHEQAVVGEQTNKEGAIHWKPPFPGRWRADWARPDGAARSWDYVAGAATPEWAEARSLVVYPLDRTRATPLMAFCPVDMLRSTLGVGPCQYILQTEGLATETNPTPDQVMTFVEQQFEKRREKKAAEQIDDLLDQMVEQVRRTEARIDQYAAFARRAGGLAAAGQREGTSADAVAGLSRLCHDMEEMIAAGRGTPAPAERTRQLARQVKALVGKTDSLTECQRLGGELRRIGSVQDRTLSKSRMMVRWLRQQAATLADQPQHAELAAKIVAQTEEILKIP
jgi:hypothetical protein